MDVEILDKEGKDLVGSKTLPGNDIIAADGAATPDAPEWPGLPAACTREGETRKVTWERLRREGRAAGMGRKVSVTYATREADRLYPWAPPPPEPDPPAEPEPAPAVESEPVAVEPPVELPPAAPDPPPVAYAGGLVGLGDLPPSWPSLPANASLQAEVSWVQANRLRVCQDGAVDLARSLSPAPSYAALSWLETSIQFPAKFADVAVKASQDQQDDQQDVRREKVALVEVQGLLSEASSAST